MYTLIKNGNIFDVHKGCYFQGDILIHDKKIIRIDKEISEEDRYRVINGQGKNIFPGFIDAHSHIGMWTDNANGNDANECVDPVTPEMNAADGVNPFDLCLKDALTAGITTIMVTPGSGNVICGTASIIKIFGATISEMTIKKCAALKIALGENPKGVYGVLGKTPSTRMGAAALLEENFTRAKMYLEKKKSGSLLEIDEGWEIFIPVLQKEIPLKIHAHRADDILTAVSIAEKFGLRYTLDHCTEGYLIVDELKDKNVPIILGPLFMFKTKSELMKANPSSAKILCESGCDVSIMSDHPFTNGKYLLTFVGMLVKDGLEYGEAIRMLTINPAKALEIDNIAGSIEEGKDADIVLYDGDPLEVQSKVYITMINGEVVYSADKNKYPKRKGDKPCYF